MQNSNKTNQLEKSKLDPTFNFLSKYEKGPNTFILEEFSRQNETKEFRLVFRIKNKQNYDQRLILNFRKVSWVLE